MLFRSLGYPVVSLIHFLLLHLKNALSVTYHSAPCVLVLHYDLSYGVRTNLALSRRQQIEMALLPSPVGKGLASLTTSLFFRARVSPFLLIYLVSQLELSSTTRVTVSVDTASTYRTRSDSSAYRVVADYFIWYSKGQN